MRRRRKGGKSEGGIRVASPFAMNYSLQRCDFYRERGNDDRARLGLDRSPLMKPRNPSSVQRPGPRQCSQTMSRFSLQGYKGDVTQASASLASNKSPADAGSLEGGQREGPAALAADRRRSISGADFGPRT